LSKYPNYLTKYPLHDLQIKIIRTKVTFKFLKWHGILSAKKKDKA